MAMSKAGDNKTPPIIVDAIIDTGASNTCVSFSCVNRLAISPSGDFTGAATASGFIFSRQYPVRVAIADVIFQLNPCMVLFHPEKFLDISAPHKGPVPHQVILDFCKKQGMPDPGTVLQSHPDTSTNFEGNYTKSIYRAGLGAEQVPALIGMDILGRYDWSFSKADKALIIEY